MTDGSRHSCSWSEAEQTREIQQHGVIPQNQITRGPSVRKHGSHGRPLQYPEQTHLSSKRQVKTWQLKETCKMDWQSVTRLSH